MKLDQYFSPHRFLHLLQIETIIGSSKIIIGGAATFALLMMIAMINGSDHDFEDFHLIFYPLLLLGGGFLFTSRVFNELNNPADRMNYLSLPASNLEKLVSKWLISAVFYLVVITIAYWIFALITDSIIMSFWDYEFIVFEPFSAQNRLMIGLYVVIQSVFLLGAVAFNKYALPKTVLSVFIVFIILSAIAFLLFRITFHEVFEGLFTPVSNDPMIRPSDSLQDFVSGPLRNTVQNFFWFALAPILWVVSYFKLKEREV